MKKQKASPRSELQSQDGTIAATAPGSKRPYAVPGLVKWGSILDLTRGPALGVDDVDVGGSQGAG